MSLVEILKDIRKTNVTPTIHQRPYPAILPTRPELNKAKKTILITGGGTGAGFAMAQSFLRAAAECIIIVGRRMEVLERARLQLESEAKALGKHTRIIAKTCDIVKAADVDNLWKGFDEEGILVDVYVANAAKFTEVKHMLDLGTDEVWSQMETNVKSPLQFVEKLMGQPSDDPKFIVNISTGSIHAQAHPEVASRPAYTLSKLSGTLLFQLLAQAYPCEKVQIINMHPGLIFNEYWASLGLGPETFDSGDLTGGFAVWAASKEAKFLHGRMVWCSWDVEELATGALRKRIDEDDDFLKASIVGLRAGMLV